MRQHTPSTAQVRGWKITPPAAVPAESVTDEDQQIPSAERGPLDLRYGYTLDDLNRIARTVVVANAQWWRGADRHQQADIAFSAVAEHLYLTDEAPTERELHAAGTSALVEDAKAYRHHHGLRDGGHGLAGEAPRFAAYWHVPDAESWEDRVLDRIALGQILPTLDASLLESVTTLAALDDYSLAADALGLKYVTLVARVNRARKVFRRHWYAPETAPPNRGTDRRIGSRSAVERTHCSEGHECTPENSYWRPSSRGPAYPPSRYCRICQGSRRAENKRKAAARTGGAGS